MKLIVSATRRDIPSASMIFFHSYGDISESAGKLHVCLEDLQTHSVCTLDLTARRAGVCLKAARTHRVRFRADIDLAIGHCGYHELYCATGLVSVTTCLRAVRLIDAKDLSQWAERLDSKSLFPELISRLILASTGNSVMRLRFRAADSIQLEGWDGICEQYASEQVPWLPVGASGWELSTQRNGIRGKADGDYRKRTSDPVDLSSEKASFIFAT